MGKNGASHLVDLQGKPLIPEPHLIVIKAARNSPLPRQLIADINKITGYAVIVMPMDSDFLMGQAAREELESIHTGIHEILDIPKDEVPL